MIPVFHIPTSYPQRRCSRPCPEQFVPRVWPFNCQPAQRRDTEFEGMADLCHRLPIFKFLQEFEQNSSDSSKEEKSEKQEKESYKEKEPETKSGNSSSKDKSNAHCETSRDIRNGCHFKDIFNNLMTSSIENAGKDMESKRWHKEVDCRGFKSRHIRVKVHAHLLLIKAHKSEESMYGVTTSNMRKSVPLPDNIDTKRITCKLSPQGGLVIEAPYLEAKARKINKHDFMRDLMNNILPGLEETITSHFGSPACKKEDKENGAETPVEKTDSEGSKENVENDHISNEDSVQEAAQDEEETCKMTLDHQEKATDEKNVEHDGALLERPAMLVQSLIDLHSLRSQEADASSVASEDSFVLLSEIEDAAKKENDSETQINDEKTVPVCECDYDQDFVGVKAEAEQVKQKPTSAKQNEDFKHSESGQLASDQDNALDENVTTETTDNKNSEIETVKDVVKDFVYRIEMPSYNPETIKVNFDDSSRLLNISASKEKNPGSHADSFTKSVHVPEDVNIDKLRCMFQDGTLSVTAPRRNAIRNIPVSL